MKSASKMATNSPVETFKPASSAPALKPCAIGAMVIADPVSQGGIALDHDLRYLHGLIGGIVEHLDFEFLARVFDLADAIHQAIDHVLLVEDWQLNGYDRQFGEARFRRGDFVLTMLVIQIDQLVTVHSVKRQQDQHHEVGNQQSHIEGVGVIQASECGIEKMRSQVMAEPVRFGQRAAKQGEGSVQRCTPSANRGSSMALIPSKLLKLLIVPEALVKITRNRRGRVGERTRESR